VTIEVRRKPWLLKFSERSLYKSTKVIAKAVTTNPCIELLEIISASASALTAIKNKRNDNLTLGCKA
jgi:hypothetical protein